MNTRTVIYTSFGILFLILFAVFTLIVRADLLRSFDFDTTHRLQNLTPVRFDHFFSLLSVIGRFEYTTSALIIFLIIRRKLVSGIFIFGMFGIAHVLELIGKTILEHPGPPRMFLRSEFTDFPGLHVFTQASYPSGHSMRTVFLAMLFGYAVWNTQRIQLWIKLLILGVFAIITSVMLYSRVTLGEHWSTDVVGGTLLGISIGFFSWVFTTKPLSKHKK